MDFIKTHIRLISLGVLALLVIGFLGAEYNRIGDFKIFLLASEALLRGEDIYAISYVAGFKYFYSPFFAILIRPLTALSYENVSLLWNLLGILMLIRVFSIIHKYFLAHYSKNRQWLNFLVLAAAAFPIYINFHSTQMSAFVLYTVIESIYQAEVKKRAWAAGLLLALSVNIKILAIVFVPYLIYRRYFKSLLFFILGSVLFLVSPSAVLGWQENLDLHAQWFSSINPTKKSNIIDLNERGLNGITSLVSSLFSDFRNPYEVDLKRHITVLPENTIGVIINTIRLGLILFTLYFLRTLPFKKSNNSVHRFWEISYLCLLIPLIFPHQQTYAFFMVLPAVFYMVYFLKTSKVHFRQKWKYHSIAGLFLLACVVINLDLILGAFRNYFWYYKTLTYGALFLLIALSFSKPLEHNKSV